MTDMIEIKIPNIEWDSKNTPEIATINLNKEEKEPKLNLDRETYLKLYMLGIIWKRINE